MTMTYQSRAHEHAYISQGPQLRHSCDACNIAKVKCSKTKPRCARCETRQVDCVYSVSLRSTKGRHGSGRDLGRMVFNGDSIDSPTRTLPPTPATPMSMSNSMVSQSIMSTLPEATFDPSVLDGWNTNFSDMDDQPPFSDLGATDDSLVVLPNVFADNGTGMNSQDQFMLDRQYMHSPAAHGSTKNSPPSSQSCLCRQKILSKLSESWLSGSSFTTPFDKALTENKAIMELCTSILACSNNLHASDTIFMLTLIALITQLMTIYDSPHLDSTSHPTTTNNNLSLTLHPQTSSTNLDDLSTDSSSATSSTTPSNHSSTTTPLSSSTTSHTHQHVRLSLGTYQLDQRDEQILKADLLRIELGKIEALVEAFERRFCPSGDDCWGDKRRDTPHSPAPPFGEVLAYLRRRVKGSRQGLRASMLMVS